MEMKNNKKGVFFTFIAIFLIMVFMIVFNPKTELSFSKDLLVVETRVTKIDDFVTDFEKVYLPNIIRSATYKALTALTYYMDVTDGFLTDLQPAFKEVLLNGTINNTPIDDITGEDIMDNNTLINWSNRIKKIAEDTLNVNLNFTITNVSIYQTTPWFVYIDLRLDYSVSSETASWNRSNVLVKEKLGIGSLYDPLYYVNTDGTYKKKINRTDIKLDEWNINNLTHFIGEEEYVHWQNSSSSNFLMRFTNTSLASKCCGIESAVNPNKITPSDVIESYVDYQFWNHTYVGQCENLYNITGVWSDFQGFKLDFEHVIKYNATNATGTC